MAHERNIGVRVNPKELKNEFLDKDEGTLENVSLLEPKVEIYEGIGNSSALTQNSTNISVPVETAVRYHLEPSRIIINPAGLPPHMLQQTGMMQQPVFYKIVFVRPALQPPPPTLHPVKKTAEQLYLEQMERSRKYLESLLLKEMQKKKETGVELTERSYKCGRCSKKFPTTVKLREHRKSHKKLQCKKCKRRFRQEALFKYHLTTHKKKTIYKCSTCSKHFFRLPSLKQHQDTHKNKQANKNRASVTRLCSLRSHYRGPVTRRQAKKV